MAEALRGEDVTLTTLGVDTLVTAHLPEGIVMFTGIVETVGTVARRRGSRRSARLVFDARTRRGPRPRRVHRGQRRVPHGRDARARGAGSPTSCGSPEDIRRSAHRKPARASTWSARCAPTAGSVATSCRATSTAWPRSSLATRSPTGTTSPSSASGTAALRGAQGLHRPQRRVAHRRAARRRCRPPCR